MSDRDKRGAERAAWRDRCQSSPSSGAFEKGGALYHRGWDALHTVTRRPADGDQGGLIDGPHRGGGCSLPRRWASAARAKVRRLRCARTATADASNQIAPIATVSTLRKRTNASPNPSRTNRSCCDGWSARPTTPSPISAIATATPSGGHLRDASSAATRTTTIATRMNRALTYDTSSVSRYLVVVVAARQRRDGHRLRGRRDPERRWSSRRCRCRARWRCVGAEVSDRALGCPPR